MKKETSVLVIQFRSGPEFVEDEKKTFEDQKINGVSFSFVSALSGELDWNDPEKIIEGYDAVFLGGSGEFHFDGSCDYDSVERRTSREVTEKMAPFVDFLFKKNVPTLLACFGHQAVAVLKGVKVFHDHSQAKIGTFEVTILPEYRDDPIFAGMPDKFKAQYGHKDSLDALPEGAELIVNGSDCKFSGLKYSDVIYSFQFHPEMNDDDVVRRLKITPGYVKEGVDPRDLVSSSPHVTLLLKNFIERIIPKEGSAS